MEDQNINSFIPKERGSLPRILLLDFKDEDVEFLVDMGYEAIGGHTGFSDKKFYIPRHESEIEIIFWDISNLRKDESITFYDNGGGLDLHTSLGLKKGAEILGVIKDYFTRMQDKGGFVGIFLGFDISRPIIKNLSDFLNSNFSFKFRTTSTLYLNKSGNEDIWLNFFNRFIQEENVLFAIDWQDNLVNFNRYLEDEDNNIHAVAYRHFAIIPKIENKKNALKYLLQDVLPYFCNGKEIFPDKYYYHWANSDKYLPPIIERLKFEIEEIKTQSNQEIDKRHGKIKEEMKKSEYLSKMLIADDSDLFIKENKLSSSIQKVLEDDLGFNVTDVDEMRLGVGESLKEDKWIEDGEFFALVEIKGSDKGAKANWIRQDLTAHIREFEVVKDVKNINSILIFNHERREAPDKRNKPFAGDTDLITFSKKSKICLIPVFELFKLVVDIKEGLINKEEAREIIKSCSGLFNYNSKI
jgi:hypothetical protein